MKFYQNGHFAKYPWVYQAAFDASAPLEAHVMFDADVVTAHHAALCTRPYLGIRVSCPEQLAHPHFTHALAHAKCVEVHFPKFTDGRSYSVAYRLTHDFNYVGLIVACGDILIDQLSFMHRCGIHAFLFEKTYALQDIKEALNRFKNAPQKQLFM